jgi:hypothetical protein
MHLSKISREGGTTESENTTDVSWRWNEEKKFIAKGTKKILNFDQVDNVCIY